MCLWYRLKQSSVNEFYHSCNSDWTIFGRSEIYRHCSSDWTVVGRSEIYRHCSSDWTVVGRSEIYSQCSCDWTVVGRSRSTATAAVTGRPSAGRSTATEAVTGRSPAGRDLPAVTGRSSAGRDLPLLQQWRSSTGANLPCHCAVTVVGRCCGVESRGMPCIPAAPYREFCQFPHECAGVRGPPLCKWYGMTQKNTSVIHDFVLEDDMYTVIRHDVEKNTCYA